MSARVALALLLALPSAAHEPTAFDEAWRWVEFGRDSGLPGERVLDVLEAEDGTPWVATSEGVAWYDGYEWIELTHEEPVLRRRADRMARLGRDGAVAVVASGILLARPGSIVSVTPRVAGTPLMAWSVAGLPDGSLLTVASASELAERSLVVLGPEDIASGAARPFGQLLRQPAQVLSLGDGSVVAAAEGGVYRLVAGRWQLVLPVDGPSPTLLDAAVHGTGALVSLERPLGLRGLWRVPERGRPERLAAAAVALCATRDGVLAVLDSGSVRLLDDAGLHEVDARSSRLRGIASMAASASGALWVATDHGLFLYRETSTLWDRLTFPADDLRNRVSGILARADGSTWLATDGGLVIRHGDGSTSTITEADGARLAPLTAIAEDASGAIWVGSGALRGGAWRLVGSRWERFGAARGLTDDPIHAIRTLPDGSTWFLCLTSWSLDTPTARPSAFRLRDDGTFEAWDSTRGLDAPRVYDVALAPDGALWFATIKGPMRFRDGAWRHFSAGDGVRHVRTFCIAVTADGRAWTSSRTHGVAVIDAADRVSYIDTTSGLVDNEVWGLAADGQDRMWVTTMDGVSIVAGDQIVSFRGNSGLPIPRCWPIALRDGTAFIGTLGGGLAMLDVTALGAHPPRTRLQQAVVERDQALVRWKAFSMGGDPAPRLVEARLQLDDGPWSAWSTSREALLRDLARGPHVVRVQARSNLAIGAAEDETWFTVPPPAWLEPHVVVLAASLVASAGALLGVVVVRRRRSQRELIASERRYRQLVETASEIVFALDDAGRIAWSNSAGARVLGREHGELTGRSVLETVAPESRDLVRQELVRVRSTGEVGLLEVVALTKDGGRRLVEVALGPGPSGGWQGIARDVTDRRRRDEELQRAQRLESLGLLAGGVAHDFNNVLAGIVGHVGIALADLPEDAPARPRLELVERAAMRCADLARQMLDYAGRGTFSAAPVDPQAVAREAVALATSGFGRPARIRLDEGSGIPEIQGDAAQLQRVLDNLLRNAADASAASGGEIALTLRSAADGCGTVQGTWAGKPPVGRVVLLEVRDSGHGMDADTRNRAFDPFFSTRKDGRGLGLAATLGIVRAHGGAIAVESSPGVGSTFTVALPARA